MIHTPLKMNSNPKLLKDLKKKIKLRMKDSSSVKTIVSQALLHWKENSIGLTKKTINSKKKMKH